MKLNCKYPFVRILVSFALVIQAFQCCDVKSERQKKPSNMNIIGAWQKISKSNCSEKYPEKIKFDQNGIYYGEASQYATLHPVWDVGRFELVKEGSVRISTSNDSRITYSVTLHGDILTFTDLDGCAIQYKHA